MKMELEVSELPEGSRFIILMNVLNKIKSKKTKEVLVEQINIEPTILPQQAKRQQTQTQPKPPPPFHIEPPSNRSSIQQLPKQQKPSYSKSLSLQQDLDDATFTSYQQKKSKKLKLLQRFGSEDGFNQQQWKQQKGSCLRAKKSYQIGDICVLEGELLTFRTGREEKKARVKLSCTLDTIQYPEGISKLILSRIIFISEEEGVFTGTDILKIVQKGQKKKG